MCFGHVGAVIYGFSSFVIPLSNEFGWTRGAISLGLTITNVTMIAVVPAVGVLIDKAGVKNVLVPATFFFGCILCSFYLLTKLWQFYLTIFFLTVLGGATSSISYIRLIVAWFERSKGLALGLGISGAGLGAMVVPPLVNGIIRYSGWREAYLILGAINLFVVLPALYFFVHNRASDVGALLDGSIPAASNERDRTTPDQDGFTFRESLRELAFWKLVIATTLLGATLVGTVSQLIPLLVEHGATRSEAANIAALLGISIVISRVLSGILLDRFHAPFVAGAFLISTCIGLFSLAQFGTGISVILATIAIGVGLGAELDVLGYLCTQYFGRLSLGRTYGILYVLFSVGGSAGAYLAGHSFDMFSTYDPALICGAVLTLISVIIIVSLGPYPPLPAHQSDA